MIGIFKMYLGARCMIDVNHEESSAHRMEEGLISDNRVVRSL